MTPEELHLRAQARELLATRDRARRGQLFHPDRAIQADDAFTAAIVRLLQDRAAEVLDQLEAAQNATTIAQRRWAQAKKDLDNAQRIADALRDEVTELRAKLAAPPTAASRPRRAKPAPG